nr:alpha/beta fold hydrolase [Gluconobacter cerinus]
MDARARCPYPHYHRSFTVSDAIQPFPIRVPQTALIDLADRLARIRWPDSGPVRDGSQGPQPDRIRALVERWQGGYDWRATETLLNGWNSSRAVIDGLGIHFLHVRSPQSQATPLLLTHGWPGSILEFRDVIGPLTDPVAHGGHASDAFHLVIPALPGFGFSDKPSELGWGVGHTARAWGQLMQRLDYGDRWMAQGGDWGAAVTIVLAHMRAPGLAGIHLNMVMFQPTPHEREDATQEERRMLDDAERYDREYSAYMKLQCTRPQSLAFALADSPVGLASWIYALFQDVSDSDRHPERLIPLDHLIDDVMLYWLPNAGPSSARFYWEAAQEMAKGMPHGLIPLPAGVSMFPGEPIRLSRRWAKGRFADLRFFAEADHGGHFAALENPSTFVEHVRATFRAMT